MRRKQLGGGLKSLLLSLAALAAAGTVGTAFAQDSWVFNNEIPCATAPVYGVPFNQCWTSNVRTFRIGNVQSWRLTYTDSKSEFAIGLYRLVAAHGVGGLSAVSGSSAVDWPEPPTRSRTSRPAPAAGRCAAAPPAITT